MTATFQQQAQQTSKDYLKRASEYLEVGDLEQAKHLLDKAADEADAQLKREIDVFRQIIEQEQRDRIRSLESQIQDILNADLFDERATQSLLAQLESLDSDRAQGLRQKASEKAALWQACQKVQREKAEIEELLVKAAYLKEQGSAYEFIAEVYKEALEIATVARANYPDNDVIILLYSRVLGEYNRFRAESNLRTTLGATGAFRHALASLDEFNDDQILPVYDNEGRFVGNMKVPEARRAYIRFASLWAQAKTPEKLKEAQRVLREHHSPEAARLVLDDFKLLTSGLMPDPEQDAIDEFIQEEITPAQERRNQARRLLEEAVVMHVIDAWSKIQQAKVIDPYVPGLNEIQERLRVRLKWHIQGLITYSYQCLADRQLSEALKNAQEAQAGAAMDDELVDLQDQTANLIQQIQVAAAQTRDVEGTLREIETLLTCTIDQENASAQSARILMGLKERLGEDQVFYPQVDKINVRIENLQNKVRELKTSTLNMKLQEAIEALYRNDRETIESALEDARAIAAPEGDLRIDKFLTWLHRGPLIYAQMWQFFTEAGYEIQELENLTFVLSPYDQGDPVWQRNMLYLRLLIERAPTGEDFSAVASAVDEYYGNDLTHSVAIVVSEQRPEPGARYRLYEIRQQSGLVIVPLDSVLFAQVKPGRNANDILASLIDQATGQQDLYALSTPVSDDLSFFGRERVLQDLVDVLHTGQMVGLFGLRKVGKTSLLQRLQRKLTHRATAVVDVQSTVHTQGVWPLYPTIVGAWAREVQRLQPSVVLPPLNLYPTPKNVTAEAAIAFLDDVQALHTALDLPDSQGRLLLVVDEVERLLPTRSESGYAGFTTLFGQLRAAHQQARILDVLFIGVDPALNRIECWHGADVTQDNELYRALYEMWMPPMAVDDVREMIESLGFQMGIRYEEDALQWLAECGGGQPFVTRQICSRAVADRLGHGAITVTLEQAQQAVEEFIFDDPYLPELWRTRLNEVQRKMLRELAHAEGPLPRLELLPAAQRQAAMASLVALEDYTLVHREGQHYTIAWDVFCKWIRWIELGLED